jgi:hypothetical protein
MTTTVIHTSSEMYMDSSWFARDFVSGSEAAQTA